MKKLLLVSLLPIMAFANKGKELHDESCVACHIAIHDAFFYTRDDRKMFSHFDLRSQVSRCAQNFRTAWFPDEEQAVVEYLNKQYYQFTE